MKKLLCRKKPASYPNNLEFLDGPKMMCFKKNMLYSKQVHLKIEPKQFLSHAENKRDIEIVNSIHCV